MTKIKIVLASPLKLCAGTSFGWRLPSRALHFFIHSYGSWSNRIPQFAEFTVTRTSPKPARFSENGGIEKATLRRLPPPRTGSLHLGDLNGLTCRRWAYLLSPAQSHRNPCDRLPKWAQKFVQVAKVEGMIKDLEGPRHQNCLAEEALQPLRYVLQHWLHGLLIVLTRLLSLKYKELSNLSIHLEVEAFLSQKMP